MLDMIVNAPADEENMNVEFVNMLRRSTVAGKPLTQQVPALKKMLRPRRVLQTADGDNEQYLGEGCDEWNGQTWAWTTEYSCDEWCIEGYWNEYDSMFVCTSFAYDESDYMCYRFNDCRSDFQRAIEKIGEFIMNNAIENGFDPEAAEQWMNDTNAEWEQLYMQGMQQDEELAMEQIADFRSSSEALSTV